MATNRWITGGSKTTGTFYFNCAAGSAATGSCNQSSSTAETICMTTCSGSARRARYSSLISADYCACPSGTVAHWRPGLRAHREAKLQMATSSGSTLTRSSHLQAAPPEPPVLAPVAPSHWRVITVQLLSAFTEGQALIRSICSVIKDFPIHESVRAQFRGGCAQLSQPDEL